MNGFKKFAKNRVGNDVPNLPIVLTQVTKTGNVGSLDAIRAVKSIPIIQ